MRTTVLLMAGIAAVGMMTSCASDNGDSPNNGKGEKTTINLSFAINGSTRTSNAPTDGGGTVGLGEGTLNNVAVGFFDAGGYRLAATSTEDAKVTFYGGDLLIPSEKSVSATVSSSANEVIVLANVPSLTNTATTSTKYVDATSSPILLSYTTSSDGKTNTATNTANSQSPTSLPMFGVEPITYTSGTTTGSATVSLERMVTRVSLNQLSYDFSKSNDAGATFVPKEIYMYNVKDELTGWGATPTTSASNDVTESAGETNGKCEVTTEKTPGNVTTLDNESTLSNTAYLSSGILSLTGSTNKSTSTQTDYVTSVNTYSFYVFPNTDNSNPTKIIIKGVYTPTVGSAAIVYYPITINHWNTNTTLSGSGIDENGKATNDSQISANTVYNLTVNIQGRGVSSPTQDLSPSTVKVTMGVNPWNSTSQAVTIQ